MNQNSLTQFELENNVLFIQNKENLEIYKHDNAQQQKILLEKPWKQDPHYYKKVQISVLALVKMTMHAKSGGDIEIMGLMQGKVLGDTMIIMDAFPLPVEGTETRVNAQAEGYEHMVQYQTTSPALGRKENVVGWYHSHPGYGCWLSGIDVATQMLNQQHQEPFLAIVIDPHRTISAGKVEMGAFRTYLKDHQNLNKTQNEFQSVPMDKMADFGVHANAYYSLKVSFYKSASDQILLNSLWDNYWTKTLSNNPFMTNAQHFTKQTIDLSQKLNSHLSNAQGGGRALKLLNECGMDAKNLKQDYEKGDLMLLIQQRLFNRGSCVCKNKE